MAFQMDFNPSLLLKNRHIQTLYAPLFRKIEPLDLRVERFELSDGDFVDAHWYNTPKYDDTRPIVILLHGLEGSYQSPYINGMMRALDSIGYASLIMHFRGCSGEANRLARAYHSGDIEDAKEYISSIHQKFPNNPLHAIGYSIGGNVLLKLVAKWGEDLPLLSAVSVSAPLRLDICAKTIQIGFARIYQRHLLKHLKESLREKYTKHDIEGIIGLSPKRLQSISSILEFDELYTAKIHGFKTAENYYAKSSARQYLKDITIPTLIIHALDDPFMSEDILPTKDELSSSIKLEILPCGGHVGFVYGSLFKPKFWLEERLVRYFEQSKREIL